MNQHETWRPIEGFPDYEVSSLGRVVSLKGGRRRELRGGRNQKGYRLVSLRAPGVNMTRSVHRLVAHAFLGPKPADMQVRHLDGSKDNNAVSNLAYGSASQNTHDQVAHGVHNMASKVECRSGHPYDEENTRHLADGSRECRACRRETKRRYLSRIGATERVA